MYYLETEQENGKLPKYKDADMCVGNFAAEKLRRQTISNCGIS